MSNPIPAQVARESKPLWQRPSRVPRGLLIGLGVYAIVIIGVLTRVAVSEK